MDIELKEHETVEVLMKEYIKERITAFGEPVNKITNNLAKHDSFKVKKSKLLDTKG